MSLTKCNCLGDECTDVLGISLTVTHENKRHSALLGYRGAELKDHATNIKAINEFAEDFGFKDELNKGTMPICSDGALLATSRRISSFYSSCNLHDAQRVEHRVVDFLPPDLKEKYEAVTSLINHAGKKRKKSEMRGRPDKERSLNIYLKQFQLTDEQKQFIGPTMRTLKKNEQSTL